MKLTLAVLFCILQAIAAKNIDSDPIQFPPELRSGRIVGGIDAEDGAAPFQCSLKVRKWHICGCSIISPEWIVTAAHCVLRWAQDDLNIYVGSNDLKGNGTHYKIEEIKRHKQHDRPRYANDIAVIRVEGSITFTDKVQPIEYSSEEVPDGAILQLTGWGSVRTQHLQIIKLNSVQTERCREIYGGRKIHDSMICTLTKVGEGACFGDSGGPLVYNNKLVGVVSWGIACAKGMPDVYAKIEYLFDWIKNNTVSH